MNWNQQMDIRTVLAACALVALSVGYASFCAGKRSCGGTSEIAPSSSPHIEGVGIVDEWAKIRLAQQVSREIGVR